MKLTPGGCHSPNCFGGIEKLLKDNLFTFRRKGQGLRKKLIIQKLVILENNQRWNEINQMKLFKVKIIKNPRKAKIVKRPSKRYGVLSRWNKLSAINCKSQKK